MLGKMIDAGMNVARLNFSHGDHESHGGCVDRLREALATRPGAQVAIMLDTKGPEIRTGLLEAGKVELIKDSIIKVTTDYTVKGNAGLMGCSYKSLTTTVKVGSTMFVADGSLTLTVTEIGDVSIQYIFWISKILILISYRISLWQDVKMVSFSERRRT